MVTHVVGVLLLAATPAVAEAPKVKVYENGGVKWQETRQLVPRPVYETKMVEQKQTVYQEQIKTEQQTTYRNFQVPITEYRWEPYWANQWNPFSKPYLAYRYVPRTLLRDPHPGDPHAGHAPGIGAASADGSGAGDDVADGGRRVHRPRAGRYQHADDARTATASKPNDPFADGSAPAKSSPIGGLFKMESDPPRQRLRLAASARAVETARSIIAAPATPAGVGSCERPSFPVVSLHSTTG